MIKENYFCMFLTHFSKVTVTFLLCLVSPNLWIFPHDLSFHFPLPHSVVSSIATIPSFLHLYHLNPNLFSSSQPEFSIST